MNKYVKIAIGVVVVAGVAAAGIKKVKEAREHDASLPQAKIYPIVVSAITPKVQDVTLTLPYLAQVANDKDVVLASRIAARIQMIKPSGSRVKKGDIVVKLDTTTIQSALSSVKQQIQAASVALKNLQATHQRTLELLKVQGASIEESQKEATMIANTQAQLNALKQKELELKNNLSYATITAPVDGVIAKTYASKGALSAPAKPLMAISSKNGFFLLVRTPTDLQLQGVALDGKTYDATPLGSTLRGLAEYKVYTGAHNLISGDRVEVSVIVYKHKGILLPFDAVLNRDGKSYVLVVDGKKAVPQEVHIIQSGEQGVVVSEMLEGKQIVVAKPDVLLKLTSGYALSIKE